MTSRRLFSNFTLWTLAVVSAIPLKVLVLIVYQLGNDLADTFPSGQSGGYACANFVHGSTPYRCNFGRLVRNAVDGAVLLDLFTVGLALVFTVAAVALLLMGVRMHYQR